MLTNPSTKWGKTQNDCDLKNLHHHDHIVKQYNFNVAEIRKY